MGPLVVVPPLVVIGNLVPKAIVGAHADRMIDRLAAPTAVTRRDGRARPRTRGTASHRCGRREPVDHPIGVRTDDRLRHEVADHDEWRHDDERRPTAVTRRDGGARPRTRAPRSNIARFAPISVVASGWARPNIWARTAAPTPAAARAEKMLAEPQISLATTLIGANLATLIAALVFAVELARRGESPLWAPLVVVPPARRDRQPRAEGDRRCARRRAAPTAVTRRDGRARPRTRAPRSTSRGLRRSAWSSSPVAASHRCGRRSSSCRQLVVIGNLVPKAIVGAHAIG